MWYTIALLSLICCTCRPPALGGKAGDPVQPWSDAGESALIMPQVAGHAFRLAQTKKGEDIPPEQAPTPEQKDNTSRDPQKREDTSQPANKKPPPRDFVPSEKIDADKAVGFPADI
jgi:hypothetical protein